MPGISNMTGISMDNISYMTNVTSFPEFMIKANHMMFGGWFYFIILMTFWVILIIIAYRIDRNNVLRDTMYSGAVMSILSFVLRAIYLVEDGVIKGILNDFQLWVFPLITILIAAFLYATKKD